MSQVIVVGGGLAGLSAAHTAIERGSKVVLLDKNPFMGGNSTKATSGINGTLTRTQIEQGIQDSPLIFEKDTSTSFHGGDASKPSDPLVKVLTWQSGDAVEWLMNSFGLDLSLVSRLGGHSQPRTHRGKERFPGMTITMALAEKLEDIQKESEGKLARILTKANVTSLIFENGEVVGVNYEKDGSTQSEYGAVIIATGGFAADFSPDGILAKVRPDLLHLPTTNGEHCTGDGIKMSTKIGAATIDLAHVQVHPTGLVHPDEPDAKVKFLAAEALRGVGGILLDKHGNRFCNELGRRDYVSGEMYKHEGPFRLVLNSASGKEIEWHVKHYQGRGIMKHFNNGAELAKDMGIAPEKLAESFSKYNEIAKTKNDPFGKKFFDHANFDMNDNFWVAWVTPIVHYCMGGLKISPDAEVLGENGAVIPGLFAAGEVAGGIHGINRLGGNSLLDCVVFGRVSGNAATRFQLHQFTTGNGNAAGRASRIAGHLSTGISASISQPGVRAEIQMDPKSRQFSMDITWDEQGNVQSNVTQQNQQSKPQQQQSQPQQQQQAQAPASNENKTYTAEEVAKHNTETDCWVIVNGEVLDATGFLKDHPGGKKAILLYAGKDASEEFNMLHKPDTVERYAPEIVIGKLA